MTATILVVDDLEQNIKLLEAKLAREYYTIVTVNNGLAALDILAKEHIDLVLLDVMMPGMDGFETCRKIKSHPDTVHIPVVMLTALSDIEDRIKGLECGADEFLTKPINDAELFTRVRSLTRMKSIVDELKMRSKTNLVLGGSVLETRENFQNGKVLLVDDDLVQAKNIKNYLEGLSEHIKTVDNVSDLQAIVEFAPDVAIISCQISDEDPLRIVAHLRSKPELKNTMLMMLTEEENVPTVMHGIELGVNDYFIYPVDKSELQARVKTQIRRKFYQDDLRLELEENVDLSIKDGLTGVFNRRYFDLHLQQIADNHNKNHHNFCLALIDIDCFKGVNDTYGHQVGDETLQMITKILTDKLRVIDLVARYGGEEFAVIMRQTELGEGLEIVKRLKDAVMEFDFIPKTKNLVLKNTISIGIAEYRCGESLNQLIERADKALYDAKDRGRNLVVASL